MCFLSLQVEIYLIFNSRIILNKPFTGKYTKYGLWEVGSKQSGSLNKIDY